MTFRCPVRCLGFLVFALRSSAMDPTVLARMEQVAHWQLTHPGSEKPDEWVQGAFYAGLCALDSLSAKPEFHAALLRVGEENGWKLGPRIYHADDLCVGQAYLELFRQSRDPRMIAAVRERCDYVLAHPKEGSLEFTAPDRTDRWAWCDSLFMAPRVWIGLAAATGNRAYRDYMVAHWRQTSAYLYDPAAHLFFRDSTYFYRREPNGTKVFWSRGNGWVIAGLARVLDLLPADDPARPDFVRQFRELAGSVRGLQQADGSWAASLYDPANCVPAKEMSGTGFFCFGLAWGINHGLLDEARYGPTVAKAWQALLGVISTDGKMTYVQPVGAAPTKFAPESTAPYGVGAFLLAGSEVGQQPRTGLSSP